MLCRQQVAGLRAASPAIRARGASLVVIGNSPPAAIRDFRSVTGYDGPLLTDPTLATYRAAGLASGVAGLVHPRALGRYVRALLAGFGAGRPTGSVIQQGGTFVLGPGPRVAFEWRDRFSGDHAPLDEVLAALAGQVSGGGSRRPP